MKPDREMTEGPVAFQRFRDGLKAVLSVPKSAVLKNERREIPKLRNRGPKKKGK